MRQTNPAKEARFQRREARRLARERDRQEKRKQHRLLPQPPSDAAFLSRYDE